MFKQEIRQNQKQTVTPAMLMGFSLLQLPVTELREAVQKELETNPALETKGGVLRAPSGVEEGYLENLADSRGETLEEHFLSEIRLLPNLSVRERRLLSIIAGNLDRDGRFTGAYPDLMMILEGEGLSDVREDELEKARQFLKTLDPKGCGARDLAECYRAQLAFVPSAKRKDAARAIDELERALKENRLETFRPSDLKAFMLLKALNPYPGRLYESVKVETVTPDIHWLDADSISVDTRDIPEIHVSPKYVEMAKDRELDDETRAFAAERVKRAREFEAALLRREETLETIAEETLSRQSAFLKKGRAGLKKLTMSEIAKAAKCTISTVSRAAARKYVKTPRGVFPLRLFFVRTDRKPLEKLREIIASLPKGARRTDAQLADLMSRAGYPLARRTIAKYRSQLTKEKAT